MKKNLQVVALTLMAMFIFTNLGFAQFVAQKLDHPVSAPTNNKDEGEWIHYDSGESDNALGLNDGAVFQSAIRWEPADLADFDGMHITSIRVYIADLPDAASVIVYQGEDEESLVELASQPFDPAADSWNEVVLEEPVAIDASLELWIATEIDDAGDGIFSSGMDTTVDAVGFGNMVNLGTGWDILTDLADIPGVFSLQAFVAPAGTADEYTVTLVVDMTDAVAVGGVAFDPAVHDVYVTGSFVDWAQPGSEGSVMLDPVVDTKDEEVQYLFPGNWENRTGEGMGEWADDGGYLLGTNDYGDAAYGQIFEIEMDHQIAGGKFWLGSVVGATGDAVFTIWEYSDGSVGDVIASKSVPMADLMPAASFDDAYVVMFDEPVAVSGGFVMGVDLTQLDSYEAGVYELGNYHTNDGDGGGAGLALVKEGDTWVPILNYDVDVDAAIFPILGGDTPPPPDDIFYTATVMASAGDHEYKYFLVEDEPSWDLGEKDGTDNRMVNISADVTFNDTWGDFGTFVDNVLNEDGLSIFPNPVRNTLYVQNSSSINEVRIFDLTGRMIMSQEVNGNEASVNVSEFKQGVYIMQVISANGVASQKFNVVK
ncbi:MAG: T9SS type A sorting domain-containing protein [Bacteroidota bacterium]